MLPLDFGETDEEADPVGQMDWPTGSDKGGPASGPLAGFLDGGGGGGSVHGGAAGASVSRPGHARKYSSQDIFGSLTQSILQVCGCMSHRALGSAFLLTSSYT